MFLKVLYYSLTKESFGAADLESLRTARNLTLTLLSTGACKNSAMATTVDQKLLRQTKFPPEFNQKVDIKKVNVEVMKR